MILFHFIFWNFESRRRNTILKISVDLNWIEYHKTAAAIGAFVKYTKSKADESVSNPVAWCILAFSLGTKAKRVKIPLTAW